MYDLRLDADVTGHKNVVELADAVAKLAKNLPQLATSLGLLKSVGDIKGLDKAGIAISSLNASVAGADTAKIREMAKATTTLAAALEKLGAQKVPKGLDLGATVSGGFKAKAEMQAMVDTMASANQAIATSLTELSATLKGGYAKAAKEAQDGAAAVKSARAKEDKDSADSARARIARLQQEYEAEVAAKRKFRRDELQVMKDAGVSLIPEHRLQSTGLDSAGKRRIDDVQSGRLPTTTPQIDALAEANKTGDNSVWAKAAADRAKAQAFMLAESQASNDKQRQMDQLALAGMRERDALVAQQIKYATDQQEAALKNQRAILAAERKRALEQEAADKARAALQQSSAAKNAKYNLMTPEQQLGAQTQARSALDQGVGMQTVVKEFGSIATLAAKTADSLDTLREKLMLLNGVKADTKYFNDMQLASAKMAGKIADDLAAVQTKIAQAEAKYQALGDKGNLKGQIDKQINAARTIEELTPTHGRDGAIKAAEAQFGTSATTLAQTKSIKELQAAYVDAATAALALNGAQKNIEEQMRKQAAAIDAEVAAKIQAANASRNHTEALRLEAQQLKNTLAAKTELESGKSQLAVASKYGNTATATAAGSSFTDLAGKIQAANSQAALGKVHMGKLSETLDTLHSAARGAASGFGAMFLTWGQIAPLLAGAALSNAVVKTVSMGAAMEHQLKTIATLSDETAGSISALKTEIIGLSGASVGIKDTAEAAKTLSLAGLKADEVRSSLGDVMNLAIAGTTDLKTSADTLVAVSTAFGYSAKEYGVVADVIAKTAATSMAGIEDMSAAFKYSTTIAEQYGVSLVDVATSLASLSQRGIQGSSAGVASRQMFQEFIGNTKKARAALEHLGVTGFDGASGKLKPLLTLIYELETAMGKLSPTGKNTTIGDLFNERANKGAAALRNDFLESQRQLDAAAAQGTLKSAGGTAISGQQEMKFLVTLQGKGDIVAYAEELKRLADAGVIADKGMLAMQNSAYNLSAGFAALSRAAMDTSIQNMMKSVVNTMQVSFVQAFDSVDNSVAVASMQLKEVFGSAEFRQGVVDLATAAADLGVAIAGNLPALTMMLKLWLSWKVAVMTSSVFGAVSAGLTSVRNAIVTTTAAQAALNGVQAASTLGSVAPAAAAAGTAVATMGARVAGAAAMFIRFIPVVGAIATVATVATAAWAMFWRDGVAKADAADGAIAKLKTLDESLAAQLEHLELQARANANNLDLEQQRTVEAQRLATALGAIKKQAEVEVGLTKAGEAEGKLRRGVGDKVANDLLAASPEQLPQAMKAVMPAQKLFAEQMLKERQDGYRLIQQANEKFDAENAAREKTIARIQELSTAKAIEREKKEAAARAAAKLEAQKLGQVNSLSQLDDNGEVIPNYETPKEKKAREARAKAEKKAQKEQTKAMDSLMGEHGSSTEFSKETHLLEQESARRTKMLEAGRKLGLMMDEEADAREEAQAEDSYKRRTALNKDFLVKANFLYGKRKDAVDAYAASANPDEARLNELYNKLGAFRAQIEDVQSKQDELDFNHNLPGGGTQTASRTVQAMTARTDAVNTFMADMQAEAEGQREILDLKSKSLGLSEEDAKQLTTIVRITQAYGKQLRPVNREIEKTSEEIANVQAMLQDMAALGASPFDLQIQEGTLKNLETKLKHLQSLREKLVNGEAASKAKASDLDGRERTAESRLVQQAQMRSERDRIVDSIDSMAKNSFRTLAEGGFSWRKVGESFTKTIKDAFADALYDDFLKGPIRAFGKNVAEGLRMEGKDGKAANPLKMGFDAVSSKLSSWWSGDKPSSNTADDWMLAGMGAEQKAKTSGMGDQLSEAWDKGIAYFKTTDWGNLWDRVTSAFNKIDWAGMWDTVKSLFGSGKPGDGSSWTDTLGGLFGAGSKAGGSTGGSSGGTFDTGMNAELGLANGGAFFGNSTRAFANGGTFSNSILTTPTYFRYGLGSSLGVAGEAGPEAVMPLGRDGRGRLGVRMSGGGGGRAAVVQHTTNLTYNLGGGVTRADLASYGSKIVNSAENRIADAGKRGDQRFSR